MYFVKSDNIFIFSYSFDIVQGGLQEIFVSKRHESSSVYIQVFSTQYPFLFLARPQLPSDWKYYT